MRPFWFFLKSCTAGLAWNFSRFKEHFPDLEGAVIGLCFLPLVSADIQFIEFSRLNLEMKMLEGYISTGAKQTVQNNEVSVSGGCP